jgi:replicative DNA helicase
VATTDYISGQSLPANLEAERSILGGILLDNFTYNQAAEHLKPEDFLLDSHRRIYTRMMELADSSRAIDQITLAEELSRRGELETIGGYAYLAGLLDGVPDRPSIEQYVRIVRDKALLRGLISTATAAIARASEQSDPAEEILNDTEAQIFQLSEKRIGRGFMGVQEIIQESFGSIDALLERGRRITGLETHYPDLDELTSGLQKSDLIIIAARPSMGKTSFAMNIAENASIADTKTVAVFSLEMSKEALLQRMLCSVARVDSHKFRTGSLWQEDMRKIAQAVEKLAHAPIFIDDTPGIAVSEMRAKARRLLQAQGALDLLIVDYLQLMSGGGRRYENRTQEVSAISRGLKALAKELKVPVVALSQLSRAPESRGAGDHRPQLADLRESGCLTGETLIPIAFTGKRIPIRELVGKNGFSVWAINEQTLKLESATASHAFSTGMKPVFELRTGSGRRIRATANHPFRTFSVWKRLDRLVCGEHIALPRIVGGSTETMLADSDTCWDSITSIAPVGTAEVFDLTVPGPHNFVANDLIVHNSIEQDADVVAFIFREEVYRPDDPELDGLAEVIIRKQRNGPTGTVKMAFLKSSTRFESLADGSAEPQ